MHLVRYVSISVKGISRLGERMWRFLRLLSKRASNLWHRALNCVLNHEEWCKKLEKRTRCKNKIKKRSIITRTLKQPGSTEVLRHKPPLWGQKGPFGVLGPFGVPGPWSTTLFWFLAACFAFRQTGHTPLPWLCGNAITEGIKSLLIWGTWVLGLSWLTK